MDWVSDLSPSVLSVPTECLEASSRLRSSSSSCLRLSSFNSNWKINATNYQPISFFLETKEATYKKIIE